jgi:hypothetical protein
MASARIVEAVDVLKEGCVDLSSGVPGVAPDEFSLHRLEECFDCSVDAPIFVKRRQSRRAAHKDVGRFRGRCSVSGIV